MDTGQLHAGTARVAITPPMGASLAGSWVERRATGVHDDLFARALVLDGGAALGRHVGHGGRGGGAIAIVSCDLIGLRARTVAGARRRIEASCGLPAERVLIAATHTHSAPATREFCRGGLVEEPDEAYLDALEGWIAEAVDLAWRDLRPARLRLTVGTAPGIAFNRRFWMRDGTVRTNPGKLNPDAVAPAGPVDERVQTLSVLPLTTESDGAAAIPPHAEPRALLMNFGLHPAITGGPLISGDFPHFLEAALQRLLGKDVTVLFANGPCGDVNAIDVRHTKRQSGAAEAERVGTVLACETARAACSLLGEWESDSAAHPSGLALHAARRRVELPLRGVTKTEVVWAREAARVPLQTAPGPGLDAVAAKRMLWLAQAGVGETYAAEVEAFAFGEELALVGLPGEMFTELGLALRARSPFRHTLVVTLANDAIGYVPTRRAYEEGGFEVETSCLAPGAGELLVEEALELLRELHTQAGTGAARTTQLVNA